MKNFFLKIWYCYIKNSHKFKALKIKDSLNRKNRNLIYCKCKRCGKKQYLKQYGNELRVYE